MDYCAKSAGKRIKKLRQDLDWTQENLAKKIFASRSAIANWETGRIAIKPEQIVKLAEIFEVSCDFLLLGVKSEMVDAYRELGLSERAANILHHDMEVGLSGLSARSVINALLNYEYITEPPECSEDEKIEYEKIFGNKFAETSMISILGAIGIYLNLDEDSKTDYAMTRQGQLVEVTNAEGHENDDYLKLVGTPSFAPGYSLISNYCLQTVTQSLIAIKNAGGSIDYETKK